MARNRTGGLGENLRIVTTFRWACVLLLGACTEPIQYRPPADGAVETVRGADSAAEEAPRLMGGDGGSVDARDVVTDRPTDSFSQPPPDAGFPPDAATAKDLASDTPVAPPDMGCPSNTCGTACSTCVSPPNGRPVCKAGVCDFECLPSFHRCGDVCLSNTSPNSCGAMCTPCTAPPNATATCNTNGTCGFACNGGFKACSDGSCIPTGSCCPGSDCTAPTIVSTTPADGATGVRKDAKIVIVFSEPMNKSATETAYASTDLPPSAVTFSWDTTGAILTITPKAELAYAMGTDLSTVPKGHSYAVTTTATDASGNRLATALSRTWSTLRRITRDMPIVRDLSGYVFEDASTTSRTGYRTSDGAPIYTSNASDSASRGFLTIDLSSLPEMLVEIERALLKIFQFPDETNNAMDGSVIFGQVRFATLTGSTFDLIPFAPAGMLATVRPGGWVSLDVTPNIRSDFDQRHTYGTRSQYRLTLDRVGSVPYLGNASEPTNGPPSVTVTFLLP